VPILAHYCLSLGIITIASISVVLSAESGTEQPGSLSPTQFQDLLADHCYKCHGDGETKGDLDLVALESDDSPGLYPALMEDLVAVLSDGEMPPKKSKPLPDPDRIRLITYLKKELDRSLGEIAFEPTPIGRMTRFQYNNAVKDLLGLQRDIFWMPERLMRRRSDYFKPASGKMPVSVRVQNRPLGKDHDGERPEGFRGVAAYPQDRRAEHGFDNRADHLTLSPLLMEQFLQLSYSIVDSKDLNARECRTWDTIFASPPEEQGEVVPIIRDRLHTLLLRAFRRPIPRETLDRYTDFAARELKNGAGFTETMKALVSATIASPEFLYLYNVEDQDHNRDANNGREPIDAFELASRLSFFFWISIPDERLLNLAATGELSDPDILSQEIERMLIDPRSSRFCDIFPAQWLQLDRLVSSIPDPKKHPYFYFSAYRSSMHMMMEPLLLFETLYIEDRSVIELLNPAFTWNSPHLESIYNREQKRKRGSVQTVTFKRRPLTDPRWGGVITNAAVMTMTSNPDRSLPITRGAWINGVIFNDPPEPPPADIPPLPAANEEALSKMTIREEFAEHRVREDCAGCHEKIDPVGFALENYGPTGEWRAQYENGREIDSSGELYNRHKFSNPVEFKETLLKERHRFIRGFAAHLLSFALGRELGPADSPALNTITKRALAGEDSLRTIMKMIAMSEPFSYKNTQPKGTEKTP
tara:strand:+ start:1810 stop:3912 length:2103 start_codon:yes stop_codon:yes gene_type:complete